MIDELEIQNLISILALHRDQGDWLEAAKILQHAAFEVHYPAGYPGVGLDKDDYEKRNAGTTGRQTGPEEIAELFRSTAVIYDDGLPHTQYMTTNLIIEVDPGGETAMARSYYMVIQSRPPDFPLQMISAGRYVDRFEKVDGAWRFSARDVYADHTGDISHHVSSDPVTYGAEFDKRKAEA